MSRFRFSPIRDRATLYAAIEYIHHQCFRLCKKNLGYILPVAGNVGVFCHFDDEFQQMTKIREELTDNRINWNRKYYRLYSPIVMPAYGDIPETRYTYLYIRRPDPAHPQVGDADYYLEPADFRKLKSDVSSGRFVSGVKVLDRTDLDLVELSDPEIDVCAFVGSYNLERITRLKQGIVEQS